jgi:hypothetical protein
MVALALTKVSPSMIRWTGMSGQLLQQMVVEQSEMSRVGSKGPTSIVKGNGVAEGVGEAQDIVRRSNPRNIPVSLRLLETVNGRLHPDLLLRILSILPLGRKATEISHNSVGTKYAAKITPIPGM